MLAQDIYEMADSRGNQGGSVTEQLPVYLLLPRRESSDFHWVTGPAEDLLHSLQWHTAALTGALTSAHHQLLLLHSYTSMSDAKEDELNAFYIQ